MTNKLDLRSVAELVCDLWQDPTKSEQESTLSAVVHLATYDLDYYGYILVQTWDHLEFKLGNTKVRWEYSLWYGYGDPIKVQDFPKAEQGEIPFIASAHAVEAHMKYVDKYAHEHGELP